MATKNISIEEMTKLVKQIAPTLLNTSNQSIDLAKENAQKLLLGIDAQSNSREIFMQTLHQRLQSNKGSINLIAWFITKRESLQQIMSKFDSRCASDASFLRQLNTETRQGMNTLANLLKVDPSAFNQSHNEGIKQVRACIQQLKMNMMPGTQATTSSPSTANSKEDTFADGGEFLTTLAADFYEHLQKQGLKDKGKLIMPFPS